jgi:hypothetical protein
MGGITFQRAQSTDPVQELEVLKNILLREGYIDRLRQICSRGGERTILRNEIVDLLDLVRLVTVETVESVGKWRRTLLKPYPFVWNGVNYLLKIPSDLDFLSEFGMLIKWLGFSMHRNPFIVPVALDDRPHTPRVVNDTGMGGSVMSGTFLNDKAQHGRSGQFSNDQQFHAIGAEATGGSSMPMPPSQGGTGDVRGGSASGGMDMSGPYSAPIINDREMTGHVKKSSYSGNGADFQERSSQGLMKIMPSHIGDLDMLRVREAEKAILQEEMIHGRMLRDPYGRLVPEAVKLAQEAEEEAQDGGPQSTTTVRYRKQLAAEERMRGNVERAAELEGHTLDDSAGAPRGRNRGKKRRRLSRSINKERSGR